jgi:hypothetical protein
MCTFGIGKDNVDGRFQICYSIYSYSLGYYEAQQQDNGGKIKKEN